MPASSSLFRNDGDIGTRHAAQDDLVELCLFFFFTAQFLFKAGSQVWRVGNGETGGFASAPSPSHSFLGDGLPALGNAEGWTEAGPLSCASSRGHTAEPWDCPDRRQQHSCTGKNKKWGKKSRKNNAVRRKKALGGGQGFCTSQRDALPLAKGARTCQVRLGNQNAGITSQPRGGDPGCGSMGWKIKPMQSPEPSSAGQ